MWVILPIVLDLTVWGLFAYVLSTRRRRARMKLAAGILACTLALAAPISAAVVTTPTWVRALAVMMMVVGFSALAEITSDQPATCAEPRPGSLGDLNDPAVRARLWARFERQFAAYVHSQARSHQVQDSTAQTKPDKPE